MSIIKEEVITTIKTEMVQDEVNPNDGNYLHDNLNYSIKCEVTEENEVPEDNYSKIQMAQVFVDCKIEVDSDNESMDYDLDGQSSKAQFNENNVESIHEKTKYDCTLCEHKSNSRYQLKKHKASKHEGVKYPCDQCDYKANELGNLKRHKRSKHEGVRYPCDQCDYKATQNQHLKKHIEMVHWLEPSKSPEKSETSPGKTKTVGEDSEIHSSDESSNSQEY